MKRYINSLVGLLLACLIGTSCTDEDVVNGKSKYESGIPVSLSLSFKPDVPNVVTRAGENMDEYKSDVYDITIFAFAENGSVNKIETYQNDDYTKLGTGSGTVKNFTTLSGINYIYAVANAQTDYYDGLIDQLKECNSRFQFLDAVATLQQNSIDLIDGRFLMSGVFVTDVQGQETAKVDISPDATNLTGKIELTRVASSITFDIKIGGDCTEFIPKSWKVVDVPKYSYLFGKDVDYEATDDESAFFDSDLALFNQNQTSITFYMTENRKSNDNVTSFKDRMKTDMRPKHATYLQLTGVYSGKANKYDEDGVTDDKVTSEAYVTYYIPLGSATNSDNYGNYETKRNTQYTYTVTVNGVKDIVVEVIEGKETSVAGGDVIYRSDDGASFKLLDAHYEARVLTFKLSDITNKVKLIYGIKTPYTEGYKYDEDATDINWVKFLIHENGEKTMHDYPGDNSEDLLTVKELMDKMIDAKNKGDEQTLFNVTQGDDKLLYVTAFIDEYYYDEKEWNTFVNKPNREMLLLCTTKNGFDSSVTDATFVLSQRSIQTYYTLDKETNSIIAVGLEWANETPVRNGRSGAGGQYKNSPNGRDNMIKDLKGKDWTSVPTLTKDYLVSNTDDKDNFFINGSLEPFTACMSRNRNSSGNNGINEADVKWFLPSIEQCQYIVLGQSGYDQGAYLYPSGRSKSDRLHFFANSKTSTGRNILWAEEGMSTSEDHEYGKPVYLNARHSIRCIRYLGEVKGPEAPLVEQTNISISGSQYKVLKMSYLNSNSIRNSSTSGTLAAHNELQENNKPYTAFAVYSQDKDRYQNCPKGWRKPNQREMSLMLTMLDIGKSGVYLTSTVFSVGDGRKFILSVGGMGLGTDENGGKIRCVRDVEVD